VRARRHRARVVPHGETVIAGGGVAVEAATALETPGRALTRAEREALTT
jgi:hypothetical protein